MTILLVAYGDPSMPKTWSGVPCYVRNELLSRGHLVISGNLNSFVARRLVEILYNRLFRKVFRRYRRIPFKATKLGLWLSNRWLKRTLSQNPEVGLVVAMDFAIDCAGINVKCVLLHDWTFAYSILRMPNSKLTKYETIAESRLIEKMRNADLVVSLYPRAREYIASAMRDGTLKVVFVCNPVNSDPMTDDEVRQRNEFGPQSKHILVVGGAAYRENIEYVVKAADELDDAEVVVDVIGCNAPNVKPKVCSVVFHGYLNKSVKRQYHLYRELFLRARCLVNIRRAWGGGASVAEALACRLPVVVGRYPDIVGLYGETAVGVLYCEPGNVEELASRIKELFNVDDKTYLCMSQECGALVKGDTYRNLLDAVLRMPFERQGNGT